MLNVTARLAVKVNNLPDWEVDWDDLTPQCSRSSLSCDHFLPSTEDATALEESAIQYTMEESAIQYTMEESAIQYTMEESAIQYTMEESAIQYTMEVLVQEFDCFKDLKCQVPSRESSHPAKTPTIVPMPILFKDEKYKAATIEIIRQLMKDANLSGRSEVCIVT